MDTLLEAAAVVRQRQPGLRVRHAGRGPDEAKLRDRVRQLGMDGMVEFLGFVDDVPRAALQASVFVLLSRWEGLPNALLEAMAAGLPVVATRVEGSAEVVRDGETGFLVAPGDAAGAARAIAALLGDRKLRDRMGRAGRERVAADFSTERMVRANETLYRRLLEHPV
jgi:glycosyltransferase involved in cell wall biosynthesis